MHWPGSSGLTIRMPAVVGSCGSVGVGTVGGADIDSSATTSLFGNDSGVGSGASSGASGRGSAIAYWRRFSRHRCCRSVLVRGRSPINWRANVTSQMSTSKVYTEVALTARKPEAMVKPLK